MCEKDNSQAAVIIVNVKATNSSPTPMTEFVFQAAVPKVMNRLNIYQSFRNEPLCEKTCLLVSDQV